MGRGKVEIGRRVPGAPGGEGRVLRETERVRTLIELICRTTRLSDLATFAPLVDLAPANYPTLSLTARAWELIFLFAGNTHFSATAHHVNLSRTSESLAITVSLDELILGIGCPTDRTCTHA